MADKFGLSELASVPLLCAVDVGSDLDSIVATAVSAAAAYMVRVACAAIRRWWRERH